MDDPGRNPDALIDDGVDKPGEVERMLRDVQLVSTYFRGFSDDIPVLVKHLSINRFETGETILQEGEEGTWMGVLLAGRVDVMVNGTAVHTVMPGDIVGEMIIWFGGVRQATLVSATPGVIASILMSELHQLTLDEPKAGLQFMRVMGVPRRSCRRTRPYTRTHARTRTCTHTHSAVAARRALRRRPVSQHVPLIQVGDQAEAARRQPVYAGADAAASRQQECA